MSGNTPSSDKPTTLSVWRNSFDLEEMKLDVVKNLLMWKIGKNSIIKRKINTNRKMQNCI